MAEINYDELFGVESEKTEEAAETPNAEESAGGKESEVAEQTKQSDEENAKYAAARRKAEAEADVKTRKAVDDAFASLGIVNPYTNKPVTTKAEFVEYQNAVAKEKTSSIAEKSGLSEDELKQYVDSLPEVREAKQVKAGIDRQRQRMELDAAIAEVTKMDSSIKSVEDLQKQDNYPEIYDMVRRGYSIPDAFKLANYDTLSGKAASAAKQAALNAKAGKEHLTTTTSRGDGEVAVPDDVKELYRFFNPKATDAEISAHYKKSVKKG